MKDMGYRGLSTAQAHTLLTTSGYNEIAEAKKGLVKTLIQYVISPIALMLFFAAGLSFALHKTFDGGFILVLLLINTATTWWQESKADRAIDRLNESLDQEVLTLRDDKWQKIPSRELVPGDVVKLTAGTVVPADAHVLSAQYAMVNESVLTGESLDREVIINKILYSGSHISSGIVVVQVEKTGSNTHFGKTLFSVERVKKQSLLERDIVRISQFLTALSLLAVAALTALFLVRHEPLLELLTLDLSLVIAGIPISLPTVMTLIIEFGVLNLAKKEVIVRRLSALEDLANVNLLLTDKTGTLTNNKIIVHEVVGWEDVGVTDVLSCASILARQEAENPIDSAILTKARALRAESLAHAEVEFVPADSKRKRSTATLLMKGEMHTITMGAPQVVAALCQLTKSHRAAFDERVNEFAKAGYRALAVASVVGVHEQRMNLLGLIALSDSLRKEARDVVRFLERNGIDVCMVTGDNVAIATQIAHELELDGRVVTKDQLDAMSDEEVSEKTLFHDAVAFAQILPEDKFRLVECAKHRYVVAANGDGVNDLPPVKAANVGFAVKSAVSALRAAADIVLLADGIGVIKDAILESRKIFERIYTYSVYRMSESLRLIITIAVLGALYGSYPMTALQIIVLALLNDIPIITLAFDRVKVAKSPAQMNVRARFTLSSLYGLVGVANSLLLFYITTHIWHLSWPIIQTMFFLKLTVSGHMLIYVAHTKERWWKFLPSREVIWATSATQLIATSLAATGFLMSGRLNLFQILFVWVWALFWMQVSEFIKDVDKKLH